ncbi:MAG: TIGR02281 family clan AA aspartic protease [Hyphomicrobiaceae bacterium]
MLLWITLLTLAVGLIAAFVLGDAGSLGGLSGGAVAGIAASAALLIAFSSGLVNEYGGRWSKAARDLLIWVGLALVLVAGYSYRQEFQALSNRVIGELAPPGEVTGVSTGGTDRSVRMRRRADGHFIARTSVNGESVTMLVDTGASTTTLKTADAEAAGIDVGKLQFSIPVQTANGTGFAAAVRLKSLAVGPIELRNVEALVARPGALGESLLGMNFLRRLKSYEFSGDFLTFRG